MHPVTLLIVDDHELVRMGLKNLLKLYDAFKVVGEAASEDEAVQKALDYGPGVVLMDIRLVQGNGIKACKRIMARRPETKVVILTALVEDELLFSAIEAGATGYVLKHAETHELVRAIKAAAQGKSFLDPTLLPDIFAKLRQALKTEKIMAFDELSSQQVRILKLITQGKTNREIADALFLSEGTVRNHVSSILEKLDVSNRTEAAAFAVEHHLS